MQNKQSNKRQLNFLRVLIVFNTFIVNFALQNSLTSLEAMLYECMKCPDLVTLPPEPTRVPYKERESTGPAETVVKKETPLAPSSVKGEVVCVGDVCFFKPPKQEGEPPIAVCFKAPEQVVAMKAPQQSPVSADPVSTNASSVSDGSKTAPTDPSGALVEPSGAISDPTDKAVPNDISAAPANPGVPSPAS